MTEITAFCLLLSGVNRYDMSTISVSAGTLNWSNGNGGKVKRVFRYASVSSVVVVLVVVVVCISS